MENHKKILIFALLVLIGISALIYIWVVATAKTSGNKLVVTTSTSQKIQTNNFLKQPIKTDGNYSLIAQGTGYQVYYFKNIDQFLISILSGPIQQTTEAAQNAFLQALGITTTQACQLTNVSVKFTYQAAPQLSGKSYPLSFCAQSQPQ